jgi:hypothetical protein
VVSIHDSQLPETPGRLRVCYHCGRQMV